MDQPEPSRKSQRNNFRNNYKLMLDPLCYTKQNLFNSTKIVDTSSRGQSEVKSKQISKKKSVMQECLHSSFVKKKGKSTKYSAIKVATKSFSKIYESTTTIDPSNKIPCTSDQDKLFNNESIDQVSLKKILSKSYTDPATSGTLPISNNDISPQTASKALPKERPSKTPSQMKTLKISCIDLATSGTLPISNNDIPPQAASKALPKERLSKTPPQMKIPKNSCIDPTTSGTLPISDNDIPPQTASKALPKERPSKTPSQMKTPKNSCIDPPTSGTLPISYNDIPPQAASKTLPKERPSKTPSPMKTPKNSCIDSPAGSEKFPTKHQNNKTDLVTLAHFSNHTNVKNSLTSDQLSNPQTKRKGVNSSHTAQNNELKKQSSKIVVSKSKKSNAKVKRASGPTFLEEKAPQNILKNISPKNAIRKENKYSTETSCELPKAILKQKKTKPQKKSAPPLSIVDDKNYELSEPNTCNESSPRPNYTSNEVNSKDDCERLSKTLHPNKKSNKQTPTSKSSNSIYPKSKNSIHKGFVPKCLEDYERNKYNSPHLKSQRKSFSKEISSILSEAEEIELNHYESEDDMPLLFLTKSNSAQEKADTKHAEPKHKRVDLDKADTKHPELEHKKVDFDKNIEKTRLPRKRGRGRKKRKMNESKVLDMEGDDELLTEPELSQKDGKGTQKRTGKKFSVTGNWYIAAGFLNDVIALLEEFDSVDGWRFADFSQCWKKKSFSHIYRGRQTFKELLEFSEEISLLTKRFLSPPHSFKRRIGALYTLYGLYHKFPLGQNNFFYLRFELDEYKMLLELIQPFRSNPENPDPAFIFRKLELEGALLHCATACEPCYDFHNEEREFVELEYGKQRLAKSSAVSNALPKQQLKADSEILRHYHSMKIKLAGDGEDKPDKVLSMISPEFVPGISSTLGQLRQEILLELGMLEESSCPETTEANDRNSKKRNMGSKQGADVEEMVEAINKSSTAVFSRHVMKQHEIAKSSDVREFMAHPTPQDLMQPLRIQAESEKEVRVPRRRGRPPKLKPKAPSMEEIAPIPETELNDGRVLLDINSEPATNQELKQALLPQPMPPKKKRGRKRILALLKAATFSPRRPVPPPAPTMAKEADKSELSTSNVQAPVDPSSSATRLSASEFTHAPQHQEDPSTIVEVRLRADDLRKTVRLKVKITLEAFKTMRKNGARYANFKKKLKPLIKETQSGHDRLKEWIVESVDLPMEEKNENIAFNRKKGKEEQQESSLKRSGSSSPPKTALSLRQRYECLKYEDEEVDDDQDDDDPPHKTSWKTEEEKDMDYSPPNEDPEEDALEFEADNMRDEDESWVADEPTRFWRRRRGQRRGWFYSWEETGPRDSDQLLQLRTEKSISMVPVQVDGALRYFPMIKTQEEKRARSPVPSLDALYTWNDFSSEKEPPFKKQRRSWNEPFPYIVTPQSLRNKRNPPMDRLRTFPPPRTKGIKLDLPNVSCNNDEEEERNECGDQTIKKEAEDVLKELADDWDEESYSAASASEVPLELNTRDDCERIENDHLSDSDCKVEEGVEDIFDDLDATMPEETITTPTSVRGKLDPLFFQSPDAQVCLPSSIFGESYSQVAQIMPPDSEMLPITSVPSQSSCGGEKIITSLQPKDNMNISDIPQVAQIMPPNSEMLPITSVPSQSSCGVEKRTTFLQPKDNMNISDIPQVAQIMPPDSEMLPITSVPSQESCGGEKRTTFLQPKDNMNISDIPQVAQIMPPDSEMLPITSVPSQESCGGEKRTTFLQPKDNMNISDIPQVAQIMPPDSEMLPITSVPSQESCGGEKRITFLQPKDNMNISDIPQVAQIMPPDSEMLPITSVPSQASCGGEKRTTFLQPKDNMNISDIPQVDIPNPPSSPPLAVVPMTTQLNTLDNLMSPATVSGLPSVNESSSATPSIGSQLCPSTLYELEVENQSKVLYYKVLTSDGNNLFIPASSFPDVEPQKIEILSFDVADVKPFSPLNESPSAKNQTLPLFPRTEAPHPVHPPFIPASPISKSSAPSTVHRVSPRPDDTLRTGKARCSFLFSSKLKPMLQHLPGASGEASGRPPSSERKVKFLFKGLLKSKRSL